jgi:hypothetical protein
MECHGTSVSTLIGEEKQNLKIFLRWQRAKKSCGQVARHLWQEIEAMTWRQREENIYIVFFICTFLLSTVRLFHLILPVSNYPGKTQDIVVLIIFTLTLLSLSRWVGWISLLQLSLKVMFFLFTDLQLYEKCQFTNKLNYLALSIFKYLRKFIKI